MFRAIAGTALTRVIAMSASLIVLILNARFFGAEGVGTIGLLVLAVAINSLLGGLAGGGSIVYLAPRFDFFLLAAPAYAWSFISCVLGTYLMDYLGIIPSAYRHPILLLSLISSVNQLHLNALLGYRQVTAFNFLNLFQALCLPAMLILFHYAGHGINAFVFALYVSLLGLTLISFILLRKKLAFRDLAGLSQTIPQMLKLGLYVQIANILQLLNYRLVYFLVDMNLGRAMLGVFDTGSKLSEGVWMVGKSVATVQYSHIANETDKKKNVALSLRLFRFTLLASLFLLGLILILPESLYLLMLGNDFAGLKDVLVYLSPGILSIACGMIISHYFAGSGLHRVNTAGSATGLIVLGIAAWLLIPSFGLKGAAFAASLSYFLSFLYGFALFIRQTSSPLGSFFPSFADFREIKPLIKGLYNR